MGTSDSIFRDRAEERVFPGKVGLAQTILLDLGFRLWKLPDCLRRRLPLVKPVRYGSEMIVADRA